MSYEFEWDGNKAAINLRKHEVSFNEASTVFADPLALLMPDPDHSVGEGRYLVLGTSSAARLLVVSHAERALHPTHQRASGDPQRKENV